MGKVIILAEMAESAVGCSPKNTIEIVLGMCIYGDLGACV